jgi:hypothetical protein
VHCSIHDRYCSLKNWGQNYCYGEERLAVAAATVRARHRIVGSMIEEYLVLGCTTTVAGHTELFSNHFSSQDTGLATGGLSLVGDKDFFLFCASCIPTVGPTWG